MLFRSKGKAGKFLAKDGLKTWPAAEHEGHGLAGGEKGVHPDGGRVELSGKVGFGPLLCEPGEGWICADLSQGGGAADFFQGSGYVFFFPFRGGGLEQGEDLFFLRLARSGFREGGEGVAPDFFLGIVQ